MVAISQSSTPMTRVGSAGSRTTLSKRKSLWMTQGRTSAGRAPRATRVTRAKHGTFQVRAFT